MGVVVTGLGVITGAIAGADALAKALRDSSAPAQEVDRSRGYHLAESSRCARLTTSVDLKPWLSAGEGRRMSRPSKLAVAAARMAVADASIDVHGPRTAVALSSAFSAVECTEQLLDAAFGEGPETASPFVFAESVANAPAAQIAIALKVEGRNVTIVQREAGVLTAVGRASAEIAEGRADIALTGSVEEMPPLLHAMLDRFESLARPANPGGEVARPFDRCRRGFIAAEGAALLVLEDESHARARGAAIRARVRAFAGAFDVTAPRIGWGTGAPALGRALRRMLDRAGVTLDEIGSIVSGASGSIAGDRLEALTLREAWGARPLPPILTPKSVVGEYGGGFLASAILAAGGTALGPAAGFRSIDPALGVTPHDGSPLPGGLTLVTSLAAGGSASWLLLENAS
jgi:3-oxoacyl-[acyl-carrier-protein] synthase II